MKQKLEQFSYAAKKHKQHKIISIITLIILVFIVINFVISFLFFPVRQTSVSMQPDINENSIVMVTPLVLKVKRGDVVYTEQRAEVNLNFPQKVMDLFVRYFTAQQINLKNNNNYPGSQNELRRVIAVPGDVYYIRDYVVYIKPEGEKHFLTEFELISKKYNVTFSVVPGNWDPAVGIKGFTEQVTLQPGEYLLLGDNRKSAGDSRLWGTVTLEKIKGKALFCYFPFNKIKKF